VGSGVEGERLSVSENGIDEVIADSKLLLIVKAPTVQEVELDFLKIDDLHRLALETALQFSPGDKFCVSPFDLRKAFGKHATVPLGRFRLRGPERIP